MAAAASEELEPTERRGWRRRAEGGRLWSGACAPAGARRWPWPWRGSGGTWWWPGRGEGGRLHVISVREGGAQGKGTEEEDARDGEEAENVTECYFQ